MWQKVLTFIWLAVLPVWGARGAVITGETADSLWGVLAVTHTPEDSLKVMYDLFDINTATMSLDAARNKNSALLNQMFQVALRARDTVAAYDVVRNIVTVLRHDIPNIDVQLRRIADFPPSVEKSETETYLNLQRHVWMARDTSLTSEQRRKQFYAIREQLESSGQLSLYGRITMEMALVLYGGSLVQSKQIEKYLRDLTRLVERTRSHRYPLKSYFYTVAPMIYDENENWEKAVAADRKMLEVLNDLKARNEAVGRLYKNYDRFEFIANRRLLSHYEFLEPNEAPLVYARLLELMESMPPNQISPTDKLSVKAMWEMYNKNYKAALPDLRTILASAQFREKPIFILSYIKAASAESSLDDLEKGQKMYIDMLKQRARDAADTEYARMRIAYEMDTLETSRNLAVNRAEEAKYEIIEANTKTHDLNKDIIIFGSIGVGVFLLIIVVFQIIATHRARIMAEQLRRKNDDLMTERDSLRRTQSELMAARDRASKAIRQKNEFIYNVSHEISEPVKAIVGFSQLIVDSIPEERRRYLSGFIDIINDNSSILQRLVGDILDTAEVEGTVTNINVSHFSPETVCEMVAENFRPRLTPEQKIVVDPLKVIGKSPDSKPAIDTDADRLEQILLNITNNAVKFCEHGTITISPEIDFDKGIFTVSVTDEGPGIPADKVKTVFERFEKLGHYSDGLGLGLFVSRELAHLLEGDVMVDTEYKHGARLIVKLPVSIRPNSVRV